MPKQPKAAKLNNANRGGDSVGIGLRGNVPKPVVTTAEPASSYDPNAPTTKPTKLTQQAGDRLFSNSERARLNVRGEHVGVGSNYAPVKPQNPAMVKLGQAVDFLKKGIYTPETFDAEVQRGGLQGRLDSVRQLGRTLFGSRGGGEIYSGSMQQSTVLQRLPDAPLPVSTQVLGDAGIVNDAFRINQPPRPGAPTFAPSRNMEFNTALAKTGGFAGDAGGSGLSRAPGLDSATKAMGYVYKPPSETGLPWAVGADPKTGEMVTLKGKPLPPLVGPMFPPSNVPPPVSPGTGNGGMGNGGMGNGGSGTGQSAKARSPFREGFQTSVGTAENAVPKSMFQRTPELTEGMGLVDRAKFTAGRVLGDLASDASRQKYWRWNNAFAIAHGLGGKLAGGSKAGAALAGTAGVYALGQAGGQFDLMNPGQAFRPKGFAAAFPANDQDRRQTQGGLEGWFGAKELVGRYVIGRSGNLLPYDQFKQERPDVTQDQYNYYDRYLKGGGGRGAMPANSFDLGGLGLVKGTSQGINGPEVRLGGISINTPAAAASAAAATGVGAIFNPKIRPFVGKALPVLGAGLDFTTRIQQGQKLPQAIAGTAAGVAGGTRGFALGVKLTPGGPIPKFFGGLVGGALGAVGAGAVTDQIAAADAADRKPLQEMLQQQRQQPGAWGAINRAAGAVADFSNDPIGQTKRFLQGGQGTIDAQAAANQGMANATDRLLQASAKYKLQRQPDGSVKSVPNDTGTNVRGEVQQVEDGDSYKVRTYNPKTGQYETNPVRLQGADTRETADHDSNPATGFFNRMIGKQMKDQGFANKQAVFDQGEKDKQAAAKLVPEGSVPYFNGQATAAHNRGARDVATESGAKDVGKTLVEQGNAVDYKKGGSSSSSGSSGGGGQSDESRDRTARLQYGAAASPAQRAAALAKQMKAKADRDAAYADPNADPSKRLGLDQAMKDANAEYEQAQGGQGDRNNESKERQTTQTNQTSLQREDIRGQYDNRGKIIQGEYGNQRETIRGNANVKVAQTKGEYDNRGKIIQGEYGNQRETIRGNANVKVAQTKGEYQYATSTDTARIKAAGNIEVADLNSGRKLEGTVYTANQKVNQEGVKQAGAVRVADIKAGATLGAAKFGADAKINVAGINLKGTEYKADATVKVADVNRQSKAETENTKALSAINTGVIKSGLAMMQSDEKNRVARLRALGVY